MVDELDAYEQRLDATAIKLETLVPQLLNTTALAAVVAGVTRAARPRGYTVEVGRKASQWIVDTFEHLIEYTDAQTACEVITVICARLSIGLGGWITVHKRPTHWYIWHEWPGGAAGRPVPLKEERS